jgi:lysophospholipase L1-like esterase
VNDLFAAVIDHPEYFADDGVHFNEAGRAVLGGLVAQSILAVPCPPTEATITR